MNTEPVKTTMRGVATTITGTAALVEAALLFLSAVLGWLGQPGIPIEVQLAAVSFVTIATAWYTTFKGAERLREKVTPWDPVVGAMTPGPAEGYDGSPGIGG